MAAPDKIYVHITPHLGLLEATAIPVNAPGEQEYIRKEALLEWAKERHNEYKQMDEDFQGDVFIGNRHALAEVIAKIESL